MYRLVQGVSVTCVAGMMSSKCRGMRRFSSAKMRENTSCTCSGGKVSMSTRCRALMLRWISSK